MEMDSPKNKKIDDSEVDISRSGRVRKKLNKNVNFDFSEDFSDKPKRQKIQQTSKITSDKCDLPGPSGYQKSRRHSAMRNTVQPESSAESQFSETSEDSEENDSESEETERRSVAGKKRTAKLEQEFSKNEFADKNKKKIATDDKKLTNYGKFQRKGKTKITAYMLWAEEAKQKLVEQYPAIDFATIAKRLGEIWATIPSLEKCSWGKRAKRLVMNSYTKNTIKNEKRIAPFNLINKNHNEKEEKIVVRRTRQTEKIKETAISHVEPINIASHLSLLGESLSLIGKLLKEDTKKISVCGIDSVLLDSLLCALGPLMCLTQFVPEANGASPEMLSKTLENIAYIMPAL